MDRVERPGVSTPWPSIDKLLAPDERFAMVGGQERGILIAPKSSAKLAAVLYLLHCEGETVSIEREGCFFSSHAIVTVSSRAFKEMRYGQQGVIEVGAGCQLGELNRFLSELGQEINLEEHPCQPFKRRIGDAILAGCMSGLCYRDELIRESLLGIEWVALDGSQVKWGGFQKGLSGGPSLHRLILGMKEIPGIVTQVNLKTFPIPPCRLSVSWSFNQRDPLWKQLELLRTFTTSWERLDWVISAKEGEKGFIFAQISGLAEEMEAFRLLCPGFSEGTEECEQRRVMIKYLNQQSLNMYPSIQGRTMRSGEYLWHHETAGMGWLFTPRILEDPQHPFFEWKTMFLESLK